MTFCRRTFRRMTWRCSIPASSNLGIKIVTHAEVEKAKPEEPEPEEDRRFDALDDPVRMYMNQMSRVPLLTREQEVEIFKRIEEAELEMKGLVYGLGFAAKEHCAIAEKLLADPPKERFDRIVVDKKVATREGHLKDLRGLVKKIRALDAQADELYARLQKAASGGHRGRLLRECQKLDRNLQAIFPKFFYKQKVLEDMIAVAGNVHEKFRASSRRIQELEVQRKSSQQQAALRAERGKLQRPRTIRPPAAGGVLRDLRSVAPRCRPRPSGQNPHGRSQPAPGGLHRQEIRQSGPVLSRSDSGRQSRAAQRGREIRISARLQVLHLCGVVDSPGIDPLDCRPGPHHSHPGAHDRDHDQALAGAEADQPGTGARAHGGRPRR